MSSEKMELKAYKELLYIKDRLLSQITNRARNNVEYKQEKKEEAFDLFSQIVTPSNWDYYGLLDKEDKARMELLEYLLNDNSKELSKYRDFVSIK